MLILQTTEYPMLWETVDWDMDTWAVEVNTFADTILDKIYTYGRSRAIVFSSFSPEICIALSLKQRTHPVYFLNDAGLWPTGDIRASSMQEAVHFARDWGLDGIVMASEPLVFCPRLINMAKSYGLICASYGSLNDEPASAKVSWFTDTPSIFDHAEYTNALVFSDSG